MKTNPIERLSPGLFNRVMLIDSVLKQHGSRLFYYSPKHIRSRNKRVPGYLIEENQFISTKADVPSVNGNWTYATRKLLEQGMGYQRFIEWMKENQVSVFVPLEFSELAANKLASYQLISRLSSDLHPYTEPFRQSASQLQHFLDRNSLVFLKPRSGNKGDQIISLRHIADGFQITYFSSGTQQRFSAKSIAETRNFLRKLTKGTMRYIIQRGVESMRLDHRVFDLRVIMLFDGSRWDWIHEARLSAEDSDLSNVSQGGISVTVQDLLAEVLPPEEAGSTVRKLQEVSFELADYLDSLHPGQIMEVAFDFVVGTDGSINLVEMNTKPGLASIGFSHSAFELNDQQEKLFQRWVYPHTDSLAKFLQSKQ